MIMTEPKPRIEATTQAIARISSAIAHTSDCVAKYIGERHGSFYLAATDGHRALLLPDNGAKRETAKCDHSDLSNHFHFAIDNPELQLAIKRMSRMLDKENPRVTLFLQQTHVRVSARNADVGEASEVIFFAERVPYPVIVHFDWQYLTDAMGIWPLTVHYIDESKAWTFAPSNDSFRYVLMPMRGAKEKR